MGLGVDLCMQAELGVNAWHATEILFGGAIVVRSSFTSCLPFSLLVVWLGITPDGRQPRTLEPKWLQAETRQTAIDEEATCPRLSRAELLVDRGRPLALTVRGGAHFDASLCVWRQPRCARA